MNWQKQLVNVIREDGFISIGDVDQFIRKVIIENLIEDKPGTGSYHEGSGIIFPATFLKQQLRDKWL